MTITILDKLRDYILSAHNIDMNDVKEWNNLRDKLV